MTNNIKCPFCQQELCQDYTGVMYCCNEDCEQSADWYGSPILWQELAQVKQDLKTATKALESISGVRENIEDYYGGVSIHYQQMVLHMDEIATNALEQIKHKE